MHEKELIYYIHPQEKKIYIDSELDLKIENIDAYRVRVIFENKMSQEWKDELIKKNRGITFIFEEDNKGVMFLFNEPLHDSMNNFAQWLPRGMYSEGKKKEGLHIEKVEKLNNLLKQFNINGADIYNMLSVYGDAIIDCLQENGVSFEKRKEATIESFSRSREIRRLLIPVFIGLLCRGYKHHELTG